MTLIQDSVLGEAQLARVGGRTMWILSNFPPFQFASFLFFDYYRLCGWFSHWVVAGCVTVWLIMLLLLGSRTPRRIYLMRDVQIQQ